MNTNTARPPLSAIDTLLRLANGEAVTAHEAAQALLARLDTTDADRAERVCRIRARNRALRDAAHTLAGDEPSTWTLALRLQDAVRRFETRVWPRIRAGLSVADLSPCESALRRAYLTGERVPATARRLYDLLA